MIFIKWLLENYVQFFTALAALLTAVEAVCRILPTKSPEGAVQRFGLILKIVMDTLKVPNNIKLPPVDCVKCESLEHGDKHCPTCTCIAAK